MFLVTVNQPKQLLCLGFHGHVSAAELEKSRAEIATLLDGLSSGFRLLTDLSRVDSFDLNCAAQIGKVMELCDAKGVDLVVRVVPDPSKDIGLNILTLFHYRRFPRTITCQDMVQAAQHLGF